jgi:hypothetical protein
MRQGQSPDGNGGFNDLGTGILITVAALPIMLSACSTPQMPVPKQSAGDQNGSITVAGIQSGLNNINGVPLNLIPVDNRQEIKDLLQSYMEGKKVDLSPIVKLSETHKELIIEVDAKDGNGNSLGTKERYIAVTWVDELGSPRVLSIKLENDNTAIMPPHSKTKDPQVAIECNEGQAIVIEGMVNKTSDRQDYTRCDQVIIGKTYVNEGDSYTEFNNSNTAVTALQLPGNSIEFGVYDTSTDNVPELTVYVKNNQLYSTAPTNDTVTLAAVSPSGEVITYLTQEQASQLDIPLRETFEQGLADYRGEFSLVNSVTGEVYAGGNFDLPPGGDYARPLTREVSEAVLIATEKGQRVDLVTSFENKEFNTYLQTVETTVDELNHLLDQKRAENPKPILDLESLISGLKETPVKIVYLKAPAVTEAAE